MSVLQIVGIIIAVWIVPMLIIVFIPAIKKWNNVFNKGKRL